MTTDNTDLDDAFERLLAEEVRLRHEEIAQMRTALASARQIGVAIGIVMSGERRTREEAFARLVKVSRDTNRKLRDVAGDVELTGQLTPETD